MPEPDEQPAQWNRVYGDHLDDMGMQLLRAYLPRIDEATEKLRGPYTAVIEPRSCLQLDDRYLGTWRGGASLAQGAMGAAVDALQTLKFVAIENGVMPMTALYPILRAVVESAALAVYLLSPPSRDERLGGQVSTGQMRDLLNMGGRRADGLREGGNPGPGASSQWAWHVLA